MIQQFMFVAYLLIADFLVEISKPKKLAKRITHFAVQFYSKNLTPFTTFNSLNIIKHMYSHTLLLIVQIFQQACFWSVSKKIFALHHF